VIFALLRVSLGSQIPATNYTNSHEVEIRAIFGISPGVDSAGTTELLVASAALEETA
jgi:hypothetical protein